MARLPALVLVGCVVCAGLTVIEFGSISDHPSSLGARLPSAEVEPAAPEARTLADPRFTPTVHRPETPSSADAASPLRDVRLTGVVIGPDSRIAIFAVARSNPLVLSEGETLKGWRLDSISREKVVLSGPAGNMAVELEPQPDADLVRPPPPAAVQSGRLEPTAGAAMADTQGQPPVVSPVAISNLSTATPVQTPGYPYYSPEYYPADDYSWGWGWGNPWGWGWPVGVAGGFGGCWNCGFRGVAFRPGFRRFGFGRPGFFHPGFGHPGFAHASFGGGFRGGRRR